MQRPCRMFWLENVKGREHLESLSDDSKIILKRIFKKERVKMWNRLISLGMGSSRSFCEHSNKPSGSMKGGEYV
jgi:uncharacterized protein (UPF0128 family)